MAVERETTHASEPSQRHVDKESRTVLAAGCTVIAYQSMETSFSALALAELANRAGFSPVIGFPDVEIIELVKAAIYAKFQMQDAISKGARITIQI